MNKHQKDIISTHLHLILENVQHIYDASDSIYRADDGQTIITQTESIDNYISEISDAAKIISQLVSMIETN